MKSSNLFCIFFACECCLDCLSAGILTAWRPVEGSAAAAAAVPIDLVKRNMENFAGGQASHPDPHPSGHTPPPGYPAGHPHHQQVVQTKKGTSGKTIAKYGAIGVAGGVGLTYIWNNMMKPKPQQVAPPANTPATAAATGAGATTGAGNYGGGAGAGNYGGGAGAGYTGGGAGAGYGGGAAGAGYGNYGAGAGAYGNYGGGAGGNPPGTT